MDSANDNRCCHGAWVVSVILPRSKWYGSKWRALRAWHMQRNPLCVMCLAEGRTTGAEVVDHIKAHRGDTVLLFDPNNLQSLCAAHHNSDKQSEEKSEHLPTYDAQGYASDW